MPENTSTQRPEVGLPLVPANRGLGFPEFQGEPAATRQDDSPGYYDVPMLKPPVWTHEIGWYFFLGGLSAGAYTTARLARRFGGPRFGTVSAVGTGVAAAAILPCAPLLILDLGDLKRFHHMLRVFKPQSPMNLGAWVLTAYQGAGAAALLWEWRQRRGNRGPLAESLDAVLLAVADFAGVPLALVLASYTGVLLSATANPAWCKSKWLPALFTSSSMSSGVAALSLALNTLKSTRESAEAAERPLHALHSAAHVAEAVTLVGYAAPLRERLTTGKLAGEAGAAVGAMAASILLKNLPARRPARRWLTIAAAALDLYAAYKLRTTVMAAGREAALDPKSRY